MARLIKEFLRGLKPATRLSRQVSMREFLSKSIAGGLSAGVVLLWWPVIFDRVDTVTSWFVRGVAWTVLFELLLVALIPFERALWETSRGEAVSSRLGAARSRLHSGPPRQRLGRLRALASTAILVPVLLPVTRAPRAGRAARARPPPGARQRRHDRLHTADQDRARHEGREGRPARSGPASVALAAGHETFTSLRGSRLACPLRAARRAVRRLDA